MFDDFDNENRDVRYELEGQSFIWDKIKYDANLNKHKITFEEAATIFTDDRTEYYSDEENSADEERFIAFGISGRFNILIVCHCMRENETVIRIISARKAEKHEQKRRKKEK